MDNQAVAIALVDNQVVDTVQVASMAQAANLVAFTLQAANPEGLTIQAAKQDTAVYRLEEASYRKVSQVAVTRQVDDLFRSRRLLLAVVEVQLALHQELVACTNL